MSEMCGWLVGLPAPAPACMCGVEGSRPQPLTQASALKETESGEARAALTICGFLCGLWWGTRCGCERANKVRLYV